MDSLTAAVYLPPLDDPHERATLGRELEAVLHDLVALALTGKQLHWMAVGPLSHSLHLQLDELVGSWRSMADTVAERAVTIGHTVDGQVSAVAAGTELTPVAPAEVEDNVLVHEVTHRIATVAERVRSRLCRVGEVDLVSQDVLVEVVRELEKQQWLLRVQLGVRR